MNFNSDFKYDLELGQVGETFISNLLRNKTIEVKFDFGTHRTGNFYIEYESRGKPSGLAKTQASFWVLIAASEKGCRLKHNIAPIEQDDVLFAVMIATEQLKHLCRTKYYRIDVPGGDDNTSKGVLIKSSVLCQPK
jgi:hypothetical protein